MTRNPAHELPATQKESGVAASVGRGEGEAGGLVPFKTSLSDKFSVNLAPSAVADRRVKRLKRSVWASGHLHGLAESGHRPSVPWFVTLTYAKAHAWAADHLSAAVQAFRNWCKSKGVPCRYTWVAEIQPGRLEKTGDAVVHYHLLAWLPHGLNMPKWDRPTRKHGGTRAPFWTHGMTNTEIAKSGVGYLMKYLSKLGELTRFPKGLRLYGIGGLTGQGRAVRTWYNLPGWAKLSYGVGELKRVGSALVVLASGEILEPAYSVTLGASSLVLQLLRLLPERFHDGAYSRVTF